MLVEVLQNRDASLFDKARACQQLAIVGNNDAVSSLAALLADKQLGTYARCALEEIPDATAETALRDAMGKLQGDLLIGVVNSVGVRRDTQAVSGLIELARHPSKGAATEALLALGHIATAEAIEFLRQTLASGPAELRPAAAEGCIRIAENQLAADQREAAMKLYDAVGRADVSGPLHIAALRGAILARQSSGVPLLLENLNSNDPEILEVVLRIAREMPGSEVTHALANFLKAAQPAVQVSLLKVLIDRNDPGVCGAVEALATSDSLQVRTAVMQTLGKIGGPSSVPILLKSIGTDSMKEADAAAESLRKISAANTDRHILEAIPSASPDARARLIAILGDRGATIATEQLLTQAGDDNPAVNKAAFVALSSVAGLNDLPELIRLTLACKDDAAREKAERTVAQIAAKNPAGEHRIDGLITAYQQARDPRDQCSLLRIMALIGDPAGCRLIMSAHNDPDEQVRRTAFRILVDWPDPAPALLLLDIYTRSTDEVSRILALRGLIRMAAMESNRAAPESRGHALRWLTEANRRIRDSVEEKRLILSGLGSLKCIEGLHLLRPYLDDSSVQQEAAIAVIQTAKNLTSPQERLMAKSLLELILTKSKDPSLSNQAKETIRQIPGESVELKVK